jgi:hypothetical protein
MKEQVFNQSLVTFWQKRNKPKRAKSTVHHSTEAKEYTHQCGR